jgi:hypothetical protein
LFTDSAADDGARAIGADADVGFAWSGGGDGVGAGRAQPATGSSATIAKFCSTDSGAALPRSLSAAAAADRKDQRNLAALTELSALTRARGGADSSALLRRPTCTGRLYVAHYNLCRVHEALRSTPAIALGIADRVWTIGEYWMPLWPRSQ